MRAERLGNGKERAGGTAIHHSLAPWSSCHSTETLTNKAGVKADAFYTQVWVRATTQRREQTQMERTSRVDFMSLEAGVTASSAQGTGKEKNGCGVVLMAEKDRKGGISKLHNVK